MKLESTSWGGNPHDPSGYTQFDALANNFATFLSEDQSYFQNDPNAQTFSAQVRGLLQTATALGFPQPQGALEQLTDFVNGIINAVIGVIQAVWSAIVNFVGSIVNFVMGVWNAFVGAVLGPAIEMVKNVLEITISVFTAFVSSTINNNLNSPMSTNFANAIYYYKENDINLNSEFSNVLPNDFSTVTNSIDQFGSLSSSINQIAGIFNMFNFPLIDQIKSLIPSMMIVEILTTLFQKLIISTMTSILGSIDLNAIASDLNNYLFSSQDLNNLEANQPNIGNQPVFTTNQVSSDPNSAVKQLNTDSFSGTNSWLKIHNPMTKMVVNTNRQSPIYTTTVKLTSVLSSGMYSLLTAGSGDPSNEVNSLITTGIPISDKTFYVSVLSMISLLSSALTFVSGSVYNPEIADVQQSISSLQMKNSGFSYSFSMPYLGNTISIAISIKSFLKFVSSIFAPITELLGAALSDEFIQIFGEKYNFLASNFWIEAENQIGEFFNSVGDILYHSAQDLKAQNQQASYGPAYIMKIIGLGICWGALIIIGGFILNKLINPSSIFNFFGNFLSIVLLVITFLFIASETIYFAYEIVNGSPPKTEMIESLIKSIPGSFNPASFKFVSHFSISLIQLGLCIIF